MFKVEKDVWWDRLIFNPTVSNSRCWSFSQFTKMLGQGYGLCRFILRDNQYLRISIDDLRDMYYTFLASYKMSLHNTLNVSFKGRDFKGFNAWRPELDDCAVLPGLVGLAMGFLLAVEIAQASHLGVLQKLAHCCRPAELVSGHLPIPRSDFVELLTIDDHLGLQKVTYGKHETHRDTVVFEACDSAYARLVLSNI